MQQRLPVGYRFHPTDGELVGYFLRSRASLGTQFREDSIVECPDFYGKTEPWVIWESYGGPGLEEGEPLYFFAQRRKLSAAGIRFHRKVGSGTWSGQYPTKVLEGVKVIGLRRDFRYEKGLNSDQNNGWLLQEFEMDESDVTVLCSLRKNPNQKRRNGVVHKEKNKQIGTVIDKKRKKKCSEDDQNQAKKLRTATPISPDLVVDLSDFDCYENTGSSLDGSLGGPASCLGVSSLSCVDLNPFDFSDNAIANALSLLQTHNNQQPSQVNPSDSSLLSSPVISDHVLCDPTQNDDAGCSMVQSISSFASVGCEVEANEFGSCSSSLLIDHDNLFDVTDNENAVSSLGQNSNVLLDGHDWSNQFEGGIGELDFSFEDVEDHYLLQSQVLDDDEQMTFENFSSLPTLPIV